MPDGPARARQNAARASAGGQLMVSVVDEQGRPVAVPGLAAWLRRVAPGRARGLVCVALVSDHRVRALNRAYRRKDDATDVLSFPAEKGPYPFSGGAREKGYGPFSTTSPQSPVPGPCLGDIVIARGVARRQARDARHSERTEFKVLALHGLLHLLGYDHERDNGRMRRVERGLRRKAGLREGLIERAEGGRRARGEPVAPRASR